MEDLDQNREKRTVLSHFLGNETCSHNTFFFVKLRAKPAKGKLLMTNRDVLLIAPALFSSFSLTSAALIKDKCWSST